MTTALGNAWLRQARHFGTVREPPLGLGVKDSLYTDVSTKKIIAVYTADLGNSHEVNEALLFWWNSRGPLGRVRGRKLASKRMAVVRHVLKYQALTKCLLILLGLLS